MRTITISDKWLEDIFIQIEGRAIITLPRKHRGALPDRVWMAFDAMALSHGHNATSTLECSDSEIADIIQADERLRSTDKLIRMQKAYTGGRW